MQDYYTEDLSKFGHRERKELEMILNAWNNDGLPADFWDSEVRPAFNMNSGYVFLVNSEYQVCMLTDSGDLEIWHSLPYSGEEGFLSVLMENDPSTLHPDDVEYIQQYAQDFGKTKEITQ